MRLLALQGGAIRGDGAGHRSDVDEAQELDEIEPGKELRSVNWPIVLSAKREHVDPFISPDPHLADAELPVDVQLIDRPARPFDFNRSQSELMYGTVSQLFFGDGGYWVDYCISISRCRDGNSYRMIRFQFAKLK